MVSNSRTSNFQVWPLAGRGRDGQKIYHYRLGIVYVQGCIWRFPLAGQGQDYRKQGILSAPPKCLTTVGFAYKTSSMGVLSSDRALTDVIPFAMQNLVRVHKDRGKVVNAWRVGFKWWKNSDRPKYISDVMPAAAGASLDSTFVDQYKFVQCCIVEKDRGIRMQFQYPKLRKFGYGLAIVGRRDPNWRLVRRAMGGGLAVIPLRSYYSQVFRLLLELPNDPAEIVRFVRYFVPKPYPDYQDC